MPASRLSSIYATEANPAIAPPKQQLDTQKPLTLTINPTINPKIATSGFCWDLGCRQFSTDDLTHTALAFEHKGGWADVKGAITVTVLQFLLGGGGSFSAGGPGERIGLDLGFRFRFILGFDG